jgi:hypothetical protein
MKVVAHLPVFGEWFHPQRKVADRSCVGNSSRNYPQGFEPKISPLAEFG